MDDFFFSGSGNEEEDQYMHMVVANLLQKHQAFVSMARGGFNSLMEYLTDVGIDLTEWIVGAERPASTASNSSGQYFFFLQAVDRNGNGLLVLGMGVRW